MTVTRSRRWPFWVSFLIVTLVTAGGVSYLASSSPDGLDSATLLGCTVGVDPNNGTAELTGSCIAQHAQNHGMTKSPLAGYAIGGEGTGGLAGIIGVLITLAAASALFWIVAHTSSKSTRGG